MSTKHFCDCCGEERKEAKQGLKSYEVLGYASCTLKVPSNDGLFGNRVFTIELCLSCITDLTKALENGSYQRERDRAVVGP